MKKVEPITVVLCEDHLIVREGLRKILEAERDIEVIGEASTGREAVAMARKSRPDVMVMDIAMPLLNGLEAARQIHKAVPKSKVLILSAHDDDPYIEKVMELGVAGYLIKQTSAALLAEAIRTVHDGETIFSPDIAKKLHHQKRTSRGSKDSAVKGSARLTPRETEVLQLVAEGMANKQVGVELGISIKTVEKHRDNLMRKLDIHDTASLTRYAIKTGIVESGVQLTIV